MLDFTAGIFIINSKNQILLTHATNSPQKSWGIPKGLVDNDEEHLDAALREVEEETGIKITNKNAVKPLGQMKYKTGNKVLSAFYVFLRDLTSDDIVIIGKNDIFLLFDDKDSVGNIDTNLLYCRSMVTPKNVGDMPFPEGDAWKWFDIDKAKKVIYQPQKSLLPNLIIKIYKDQNCADATQLTHAI